MVHGESLSKCGRGVHATCGSVSCSGHPKKWWSSLWLPFETNRIRGTRKKRHAHVNQKGLELRTSGWCRGNNPSMSCSSLTAENQRAAEWRTTRIPKRLAWILGELSPFPRKGWGSNKFRPKSSNGASPKAKKSYRKRQKSSLDAEPLKYN